MNEVLSSPSARGRQKHRETGYAWLLIFALAFESPVAVAGTWHVIAWPGSTPEWTKKLGVDELRIGCKNVPAECLHRLDFYARKTGVSHVTLAINSDPDKVAAYAREFSDASLSEHRLRGIGIDDFVSTLLRWQRDTDLSVRPGELARKVIANTKQSNPRLEFGITLYEDQLVLDVLKDNTLPPDVRASIDRVSLYLHFRSDAPRYPEYVQQTKRLFPNAAIVAGIYPYDRIDYLPCKQGGKIKCSAAQELGLFEEALRIQAQLMIEGKVAALEFIPGNFGNEAQWRGWHNPRVCQPSRRQDCIDMTVQMHAKTLAILREVNPNLASR